MPPVDTGRGRRDTHPLREIVDAIPHVDASAREREDLRHDFPPPTSVSHHYREWAKRGTWRRVTDALRERVREAAGRDKHPSAGATDRQAAKAASTGGHRGYDGGKATSGRKRHAPVDAMGRLIVALATAARGSDAAGPMGLCGGSAGSIGRGWN